MRRLGIAVLLCSLLVRAHAADAPAPRFVVFFQEWSAALDQSALTVIQHVSDYARAHDGVMVHVNAFADPTGSRKANELLTDLRAQVVMDQLHADGVSDSHVIGRGHGSVQFALTSQESRRVEISFAGQ